MLNCYVHRECSINALPEAITLVYIWAIDCIHSHKVVLTDDMVTLESSMMHNPGNPIFTCVSKSKGQFQTETMHILRNLSFISGYSIVLLECQEVKLLSDQLEKSLNFLKFFYRI